MDFFFLSTLILIKKVAYKATIGLWERMQDERNWCTSRTIPDSSFVI